MDEKLKEIEEMETKEALDQSVALGKLALDILEKTNRNLKRVYIILAISIFFNFAIVGAFLWYESGMETVDTSTETITQDIEGDSAINNFDGDQYNDDAINKKSVPK